MYKDKSQQREYQRAWMAQRRSEWLLSHGPCIWCGSWISLEVDHVDPSKKITHRVWSFSEEKRVEELSKCQVLCWQCHKRKTQVDSYAEVMHGSETMYARYKCRCDPCRLGEGNTGKSA